MTTNIAIKCHAASLREGETSLDTSVRRRFEDEFRRLVEIAEASGFHVEISRQSLEPLAMRNARTLIYVWKAR